MGNDGGSIPKRRELVKEAARLPSASELKATALESLAHAWSTCAISASALDPRNTVSDARGRLYDYETVLRRLMPGADESSPSSSGDRGRGGGGDGNENGNGDGDEEERQSQEAAGFARSGIRSLRDIVKLRFHVRRDEARGEVRTCPLSMRELGPATRAVYLVPCGHVFAETAMRELLAAEEGEQKVEEAAAEKERTSRCPECSEAFAVRDVVPVLPVDEADVEKCAARIDTLRALGLAHNLKKDKAAAGDKKKKKKRKAAEGEEEGDGDGGKPPRENGTSGDRSAQREKKQKRSRDDISSRINNAMTATLTAKVLAEQDERNRQRKLAATVR
ncbi:Rtf2 RING-finger-domain-containing protein [Nemania sp. NC0429]|nr:Rtf2 RING-finger-domain-containing protein [Nemania sp. NC0429]